MHRHIRIYSLFYMGRRITRGKHRRGYLRIQDLLPLTAMACVGFGLVVMTVPTLLTVLGLFAVVAAAAWGRSR